MKYQGVNYTIYINKKLLYDLTIVDGLQKNFRCCKYPF